MEEHARRVGISFGLRVGGRRPGPIGKLPMLGENDVPAGDQRVTRPIFLPHQQLHGDGVRAHGPAQRLDLLCAAGKAQPAVHAHVAQPDDLAPRRAHLGPRGQPVHHGHHRQRRDRPRRAVILEPAIDGRVKHFVARPAPSSHKVTKTRRGTKNCFVNLRAFASLRLSC